MWESPKVEGWTWLQQQKRKQKIFILSEKSYNKTVIDFNFGRHANLFTLKNEFHLGRAASANNYSFG